MNQRDAKRIVANVSTWADRRTDERMELVRVGIETNERKEVSDKYYVFYGHVNRSRADR